MVRGEDTTPDALEEIAIPDELREAWTRLEASGLVPPMKRALARVASGESYRRAAAAEGYEDHAEVWRWCRNGVNPVGEIPP